MDAGAVVDRCGCGLIDVAERANAPDNAGVFVFGALGVRISSDLAAQQSDLRPGAEAFMNLFDYIFRKSAAGDTWKVATSDDRGKPLILRIRNAPPYFARKSAFRYLLAVCWKYESPNDQGMPSQIDADQMTQLEDILSSAFEGKHQAFLSVIVTGNGVREWQWYARDEKVTMQLVNESLGQLEPFPVEFVFQEDPDWQGYARFQGIE